MELLPLRKFSVHTESSEKPSMTIPDMALSIPELLRRCVNNIPLPVRSVEYDDNPDIDNPLSSATDLTDFNELLNPLPDIVQPPKPSEPVPPLEPVQPSQSVDNPE